MQINFVLDPLTLTPKEQMAHELAIVRAKHYRIAEIDLITSIEEVDRLRLYEKFRLTSTHAYCQEILNLSPNVTANFIYVARKTRVVEGFKEAIADGDISMSAARKMCSVITEENKEEWLEKGSTLTTAELEREVAKVNPQAVKPASIKPVGLDRNRVAYETTDRCIEKKRRVRELESQRLGRQVSIEEAEEAMADAYLAARDPVVKADRAVKRKQAEPTPATGQGTTMPAQVEHSANHRDRGECQIEVKGKKCRSTKFVHLHHIKPLSEGGLHTLENIITVCSAHHRQIHEDQELTV